MAYVAQIDIYSHGVKFSRFGLQFARLLGEFLRVNCLQTTKKRDARTGKMVTEVLNTFAAARSDYTEVFILRTQLDLFYEFAAKARLRREYFDVKTHAPGTGKPTEFTRIWKHTFRDDQEDWLTYMTKDNDCRFHMCNAQTGAGKSAMAMEVIKRRGVRTGIMMSPTFFGNWHGAMDGFFDYEVGDIIEIRGKQDKEKLHPRIPVYSMEEYQDLVSRDELDFKIVLISHNMMRRYMSQYEANNCIEPYAFKPYEFFERSGIGLLIVDEAHLELHHLFKTQCYGNVAEMLYLSATVETDDTFVQNLYNYMFPIHARYRAGAWEKYINSTAVTYSLKSRDKVRFKGYGGSYSHTEYEKSIMKSATLKKAYFNFIYEVIENAFIKSYRPGQKMLVYCSTVAMCQALAEYLKERIQDLTIGPYTQKEDFQILLSNDASVTTFKSAGTGVDVPNLVFVFMTFAMGSRAGNIQILGRLRKLRGEFEDVTPEFYYLVCNNIEAHRKYHFKKVENFADKVLTQRILDTDFEL